MKKQVKKSSKKMAKAPAKKTSYTFIESNIYKTGSSYRVRVGQRSEYVSTLRDAKHMKKLLKGTSTCNIF